jgi:hypothetical protein
MAGTQVSPEVIATKLHRIEVLQEEGRPIPEAVRQVGITEPIYRRWRRHYGGMSQDEIRWARQLIEESRWPGALMH